MKLTDKAVTEVKDNKRLRTRLALELNRTDYTIIRWLDENSDNGLLTTAGAIKIIKEETDLLEEEILCDAEPAENLMGQ